MVNKQSSSTPRNRPSVVGTGLLALDVVINDDDCFATRRWAGGTCGNVLTILSYLDWDAYPVARLNGETASMRVLTDLEYWGVHLAFAKSEPRSDAPIVVHKIIKREGGEAVHRFSLKCPHCGSWLPRYKAVVSSVAQRVAARIGNPKVFFLDRVSRGSLVLAKASADRGALIVFEPPRIEDSKLFREALALTHVLKYATDRIHAPRQWTSSARPLLEIETLGSKGLRYRGQITSGRLNRWQRLEPCVASRVTDTAGAGDWCTAGIIHYLGQEGLAGFQATTGIELQEALRFGQALAAWNCGFEGARGGMYAVDRKTFETSVTEIMRKDWETAGNRLGSHFDSSYVGRSTNRHRPRVRIPGIATPNQAQDACCF